MVARENKRVTAASSRTEKTISDYLTTTDTYEKKTIKKILSVAKKEIANAWKDNNFLVQPGGSYEGDKYSISFKIANSEIDKLFDMFHDNHFLSPQSLQDAFLKEVAEGKILPLGKAQVDEDESYMNLKQVFTEAEAVPVLNVLISVSLPSKVS